MSAGVSKRMIDPLTEEYIRFVNVNYIKEQYIHQTTANHVYEKEAIKIFCRWIMNNKSLNLEDIRDPLDAFLPVKNVRSQTKFCNELVQKGSSDSSARMIYCNLLDNIDKFIAGHEFVKVSPCDDHYIQKISVKADIYITIPKHIKFYNFYDRSRTQSGYLYIYRDIGIYVSKFVFDRLVIRYQGPKDHNVPKEPQFSKDIMRILMRYAMLNDASGLQGEMPIETRDTLSTELDIQFEGFASPFNAHLPYYCSLFPDTDELFGSLGSFFNFDFVKSDMNIFQVCPPFIDGIFTQTANKMLSSLEESEKLGKPLGIFYMMVRWRNCESLELLTKSRFNRKHISLIARQHCYEWNQKKTFVPFDSEIIILQNSQSFKEIDIGHSIKFKRILHSLRRENPKV
jgi:hypothetical protein